MAKTKQKFREKLRRQYRLVILNDSTFEERLSVKLTRLNVIIIGSTSLVLLVLLLGSMIVFTPLKEYIPGYADVDLRRDLNRLYMKTDSLEKELDAKSLFLASIRNVVSGDIDVSALDEERPSDGLDLPEIVDTVSEEELRLREAMESQNLDIQAGLSPEESLFDRLNFFTPVRGIITQTFNSGLKHYAVDIATAENASVKATLDGTVVQATYSIETGYVVVLQHNNNLISAYKHNSSLLKKVGTFVRAGEAIAIAGDSGELSTGPHLHFEIWFNGTPVNPQDLIRFEE